MDFDLKSFSKNKNYVIRASAGTGKTYNIVKIVRSLILDDVPLKEMLIVTYTDKAAGELKDRIRKEINDIIQNSGGKYTKESLNIDDAFIGTIHSFCKSVIDEYGLSANLPLNLKLIDKSEIDIFLNEYIRKGQILEDLYFLNSIDNIDIESLINWLKEGINKYYLDNDYKENRDIVSLDDLSINLENFEIDKLALSYKTIEEMEFVKPDLFKQYKILRDSPNDKAKRFAAFLNTSIHNQFKFLINANKETGQEGFREKDFKGLPYETEAYKYFADRKKSYEPRSVLVYKYLKDLYKSWQEYKKNNKLETFDDIIRNVLETINKIDSKLLSKLQSKYKYGIIDEFQDTNQKQYIIFKKIFLSDSDHRLIVVGDKKQSIYSFQGADVKVFEIAVNEMIDNGAVDTNIKKNYRSSESIVDSCNYLFSLDSFGFNGDFINSDSLKNTDDKWFNALYKGKPIKSFYINSNPIKRGFYPRLVANQIIDFCSYQNDKDTNLQLIEKNNGIIQNPRNVSFKDFAVLAKTRSEMNYICDTFERLGIPYIKYKDNSLFKSKECFHWIILLEAISIIDFTGYNRNAFKKALFTDFFEYSLSTILDVKFDRDDIDEISLFNKWKKYNFENNYEELISSIIYQSNLIKNLESLSRMQSLIIYKQLGDYCLDFLNKNSSIDLLISTLKKLSTGASIESDEDGAIVAKGTEFNAVSVMTIHASKGLEYPVVIAVAGCASRNNFAPPIFYHRDGANPKIIFDSKEGKKDEIEELRRLFYVCYTRAKYILFLPNYESYGDQSGKIIATPISELIKNNIGQDFPPNIESNNDLILKVKTILLKGYKANLDSNDIVKSNSNTLINNRTNTLTYKHSYSSLAHANEEEVDDLLFEDISSNNDLEGNSDLDTDKIDKDNIIPVPSNYKTDITNKDTSLIPKGKYAGNALHELFEVTDFTKDVTTISTDLITFIFNKQRISFKDNEAYKVIRNIVEDTLKAQIPVIKGNRVIKDNYFSLSMITNDNKKAEIEFNFNMVNKKLSNYCNGFMDLIIKRDEIYSVLDYKTDSLNDDFKSFNNLEDLKNQVDSRYAVQRVLYSYTLIKYLSKLLNKDEETVFNNNFGGVHYIFVRGTYKDTGNGIYSHTWSSYDALKRSYITIIQSNNIKETN